MAGLVCYRPARQTRVLPYRTHIPGATCPVGGTGGALADLVGSGDCRAGGAGEDGLGDGEVGAGVGDGEDGTVGSGVGAGEDDGDGCGDVVGDGLGSAGGGLAGPDPAGGRAGAPSPYRGPVAGRVRCGTGRPGPRPIACGCGPGRNWIDTETSSR